MSTAGILGVMVWTLSTIVLIASRAISWPLRTIDRNWSCSSFGVLVVLAIVFCLPLASTANFTKQRLVCQAVALDLICGGRCGRPLAEARQLVPVAFGARRVAGFGAGWGVASLGAGALGAVAAGAWGGVVATASGAAGSGAAWAAGFGAAGSGAAWATTCRAAWAVSVTAVFAAAAVFSAAAAASFLVTSCQARLLLTGISGSVAASRSSANLRWMASRCSAKS